MGVCLSLPGRQCPSRYPQHFGKGLVAGYDSHMSVDGEMGTMFGVKTNRYQKEWVFFNEKQLLPCYLVTLDFLQNKAKAQMDAVCTLLNQSYHDMTEEKLKTLNQDDMLN